MYLIKTEEEYENAIAEFEKLIDQDPEDGTEEAKKLELMGLLISVYEKEYYPIDLPNPIDAIRFRMEQQGLNQRDLIPFIGSRSKVSEILSGKRSLTVKMIRALHENLGIPSEILIQDLNSNLENSNPSIDFDKVPFNEMFKNGWFEGFSGTLHQAKQQKEELLSTFFKNSAGTTTNALYRKSLFRGSETDDLALYCWRIRVATLAKRIKLKQKHEPGTVDLEFMRDLANLSVFPEGPKLVKDYMANHGISFVIERHLQRTKLDGAAFCLENGTPVVALTLRHDRIDNFWFSLLHELAHISLHLDRIKDGEWFADDLDTSGNDDETEQAADDLAKEALISSDLWDQFGLSKSHSQPKVVEFANMMKRHPAIIAGRIRKEKNNYRILTKMVGQGKVRNLFGIE